MRYPVPPNEDDKPKAEEDPVTPKIPEPQRSFAWDMNAQGQITAHIIPKVTFGIVFDSSKISNGALDIGIDTHVQLYANAKAGTGQSLVACYGANGGTELFGNVEAPTVFGKALSKYYELKKWGSVSLMREVK